MNVNNFVKHFLKRCFLWGKVMAFEVTKEDYGSVHVYHVLKESYGYLQNFFAFCVEVESFLSLSFREGGHVMFLEKIMVLYKML